jgi:hypothetical protein
MPSPNKPLGAPPVKKEPVWTLPQLQKHSTFICKNCWTDFEKKLRMRSKVMEMREMIPVHQRKNTCTRRPQVSDSTWLTSSVVSHIQVIFHITKIHMKELWYLGLTISNLTPGSPIKTKG